MDAVPAATVWSECGRFWYDRDAAEAAVAFFPKYLRFTEGEWAGLPFHLEDWQANDIIRPLFGWKRKDGTRRYRRCYVWVPRKNGKTELAAGIALLMLMGDGEIGGQVLSIAHDKDQAAIVFNKAVSMIALSEELSRWLTPFTTSIWCAALTAGFRPLSGKPTGKHGLNMSGLIGDEIHEWRDSRLYTFVHQSSAARRQALEFLISTAGERTGYGWEIWNTCIKILSGDLDDPETLVIIYAANPEADWTDPEVWKQANPNLGVSIKMEYLEAECRKARELPRYENDFKRYHLNIWTEQEVRWIPLEAWDACGHPVEAAMAAPVAGTAKAVLRRPNERWREFAAAMAGRKAFGGVDLSSTADLTALVWVFPPDNPGGRWVVLPRFFIPENRIMERVRRDKVPYDQWVKIGAVTATPGNVVDYAFVKQRLFEDCAAYRHQAVGFDPWNAMQMLIEVREAGINGVQFRQGFASMSEPSKKLEKLVLECQLDHGGHPTLRWCAGNVAIDRDAADNIKPAKDKSTERIDGMTATIVAIGCATKAEAPPDLDSFLKAPVIV